MYRIVTYMTNLRSGRPGPGGRAGAWLVVGLLWVAGASNYLTRFMIVTMHGSIEAAIPMNERQFGLLSASFLLVYALLNPVGGMLADRFSRSGVIIASLVAWSGVTWLTAFATTFPQLLILRTAMGAAQACYMPAASALISDYHPGATRSRAIGLHMTGLVFGSMIGGLGGWLADARGWTFAFQLLGLPGIAFGGLLAWLLRDAPRAEAGPGPTPPAGERVRFGAALAALVGSLAVAAIIVIFILQNAVSWVVIGWMPTYLREHFNLTQGAAGISATGYLYAAQLVGLLAGGAWADRWSRRNERARFYVPVLGLGLAAPGFWLAAHSPLMGAVIVCLSLWGLATGMMGSNVMPILCLITDPRYRATAYGLANGAGAIAGGLSLYGAGAMRDLKIDLSKGMTAAGICAALCALLFLLVGARRPPRPEPALAPPGFCP